MISVWSALTPLLVLHRPARLLPQIVHASSLALDLSLLCESWLKRIHKSIRSPERATVMVPELIKQRRHLRAQLQAHRKTLAGFTIEQQQQQFARGGLGARRTGRKSKRDAEAPQSSGTRGGSSPSEDGMGEEEGEEDDEEEGDVKGPRTIALAAWDARRAIVDTQIAMARQEASLCWLLCSGLPEAVVQMMPEMPEIISDLDQTYADHGSALLGDDASGGGDETMAVDGGEPLDARRLRVLSISSAPPPPILAHTEVTAEPNVTRLRAALALFSGSNSSAASASALPTHRGGVSSSGGGGGTSRQPALEQDGQADGADVLLCRSVDETCVALSAAEGGGHAEPCASPVLACFKILGGGGGVFGGLCGLGEQTTRRARLRNEPCLLNLHRPRDASTLRASLLAVRELRRLQCAGCGGALHVAPIHEVWCESVPGDLGGVGGGSSDGRRLICVHMPCFQESLTGLLADVAASEGMLLEAQLAVALFRDVAAALATLHSVGLCCDRVLTAESVAIVPDPVTGVKTALLCSAGRWAMLAPDSISTSAAAVAAAGDSGSAGGMDVASDDPWALAAHDPAVAHAYGSATMQPQPSSAFASDIWALGILGWRLRAASFGADEPPPFLGAGEAGLVPPQAFEDPTGCDALLHECLCEMLRAEPSERPAAGEVLALPLALDPLAELPAPDADVRAGPHASSIAEQVAQIQQELVRLRRLAAPLAPVHAMLDLAALPAQLLGLLGTMDAQDLFCRFELSLVDSGCASPAGGTGGYPNELGGGGAPLALPLESILALFWRAARQASLPTPLLQLPTPPAEPDPTPGLACDAPLPPLDCSLGESDAAVGLALGQQESLGRLLLLSLAHGVPLPSWLPPATIKALLLRNDTLDLADLQACRPRFACRCALVLSSVVGNDFEWVDGELPELPTPPLEFAAVPDPEEMIGADPSNNSENGFGAFRYFLDEAGEIDCGFYRALVDLDRHRRLPRLRGGSCCYCFCCSTC